MFSMSKANDRERRETKENMMSFHKIAPVKKHDCKKGAPAPRKKAPKKPAPAPKRRPVGHKG